MVYKLLRVNVKAHFAHRCCVMEKNQLLNELILIKQSGLHTPQDENAIDRILLKWLDHISEFDIFTVELHDAKKEEWRIKILP